jgi:hypothetical protein
VAGVSVEVASPTVTGTLAGQMRDGERDDDQADPLRPAASARRHRGTHCPPPDVWDGSGLRCGKGVSWTCRETGVAWLARGPEPTEQARAQIDALLEDCSDFEHH